MQRCRSSFFVVDPVLPHKIMADIQNGLVQNPVFFAAVGL
jgi:hypothetical protein